MVHWNAADGLYEKVYTFEFYLFFYYFFSYIYNNFNLI